MPPVLFGLLFPHFLKSPVAKMKILQDFIAPVVRFDEATTNIVSHQGTAFFIDGVGTFLTARHVVEDCIEEITSSGGRWGLVMRHDADRRVAGFPTSVEFAPAPFDVAIARVDKPSKSHAVFDPKLKMWMWTDVYTAGYPASIVGMADGRFDIDARGHRGTVLRQVNARQPYLFEHPDLFELSFAITSGLSGAPLVLRGITGPDGKAIPYFVLAGVCVGSVDSTVVAHSRFESKTDKMEHIEVTSRIEQVGIAHDLRALADWQPKLLNGKPLQECIRPVD